MTDTAVEDWTRSTEPGKAPWFNGTLGATVVVRMDEADLVSWRYLGGGRAFSGPCPGCNGPRLPWAGLAWCEGSCDPARVVTNQGQEFEVLRG